MDKVIASPEQAVAEIPDGATVAIAGFSVGHRFAGRLVCIGMKGRVDKAQIARAIASAAAP